MLKAKLTDGETQVRFARFLVVGATAYGVQITMMKLTLLCLATNAAFVVSFIASTGTHYALNRFWALPSGRTDSIRQLKEYVGAAAISFIINFSLFRLCIDGFGLGRIWATAIAVPPSTVVVFLLLNYRVFRARE